MYISLYPEIRLLDDNLKWLRHDRASPCRPQALKTFDFIQRNYPSLPPVVAPSFCTIIIRRLGFIIALLAAGAA